MAGEAFGQKGPIYTRTPAFYMDIQIEAGKGYRQNIPKGWNSICYILEGEGNFGADE